LPCFGGVFFCRYKIVTNLTDSSELDQHLSH
jgi:hypothetical protein